MAGSTIREVLEALKGQEVTITTLSGDRFRGRIRETGEDYIMFHREQMVPLYVRIDVVETVNQIYAG